MTKAKIFEGFRRLGELIGEPVDVAITGGAALMFAENGFEDRVTNDVDAIYYNPAQANDEVESLASKVGEDLGLGRLWLTSDEPRLYRNILPDDWYSSVRVIGQFGKLRVVALSRLHLALSKFYAHRPPDLDDLRVMRLSAAELQLVDELLRKAFDIVPDHEKLKVSRFYVAHYQPQPD